MTTRRYLADVISCLDTTPMECLYDIKVVVAIEYDKLEQTLEGEREAAKEAAKDFFRVQSENQNLWQLLKDVEGLFNGDHSTGVCCCGSDMLAHGFGDGHSPVDSGDYYADGLRARIKAALEGK